jgi:hypothetical protein
MCIETGATLGSKLNQKPLTGDSLLSGNDRLSESQLGRHLAGSQMFTDKTPVLLAEWHCAAYFRTRLSHRLASSNGERACHAGFDSPYLFIFRQRVVRGRSNIRAHWPRL